MRMLLVTTDLIATSMLEGAARSAGLQLIAASPSSAGSSVDSEALAVLIDLGAPSLDLPNLVAQLRAAAPDARLIAFGPHVHRKKLELARELGCDQVLSRGELHARANKLLADLAGQG